MRISIDILGKTWPFIVLRFVVILCTTIPVWVASYYAGFLFGEYFGIHHPLFIFSYMFITFMAGYILMNWFRKIVLFYVKAAHIAALTMLLTNIRSADHQILDGFGLVFSKLFSTSLFLGADSLTKYGLNEISRFIFDRHILPSVNNLNFLVRWLGKVIKTTLSYSDEIVLSYIFYCEMDENNKKRTGRNALDGIILYVKSSLKLLKAAFMALLGLQIFSWLCEVLVVVGALYTFHISWVFIAPVYFALKYVFSILEFTLTEPYETVSLLSAFYDNFEPFDEYDMDIIAKLSSISNKFSSFASRFFDEKINKVNNPEDVDIIDVDSIVTDHISNIKDDILS